MTIRPLAESEFPKPLLFCCTNRQRAAGCAVFQAAPGAAGLRLRWRPSCALRPLDGAGELDARGHAHLAEDVPQVGLDGLLAEEQLVRDLRVGLAVDHEHGELELAFGQRLERRPGRTAPRRALLNAMPELPQLSLRLAAVARSSGLPEVVGGTSELGYGALTVTRLGERAARKRRDSAPSTGAPASSAAAADASARSAARSGSPPSSSTAAEARSAQAAAIGSCTAEAQARAVAAARSASAWRSSASQPCVSTSRYRALGLPAMRVNSSPPDDSRSSSPARSGSPVSSRAAARSAAPSDEWKLLSPWLRSTLSCAVASARSVSPLRSAAAERPRRVQHSACVLPKTRATSMPPSRSSADSASLPRCSRSPPSVATRRSNSSPWPVARASVSARLACASPSAYRSR